MIQYIAFKWMPVANLIITLGMCINVGFFGLMGLWERIAFASFFGAIALLHVFSVKNSYLIVKDGQMIYNDRNIVSIDEIVSVELGHWNISIVLVDGLIKKFNISDISKAKRKELKMFLNKMIKSRDTQVL